MSDTIKTDLTISDISIVYDALKLAIVQTQKDIGLFHDNEHLRAEFEEKLDRLFTARSAILTGLSPESKKRFLVNHSLPEPDPEPELSPTNSELRAMDEYQEGRNARLRGVLRVQTPYAFASTSRVMAWWLGWDDEQEAQNEAG